MNKEQLATPRVQSGSELVSGVLRQDAASLCGVMHAVFGADVYRNSTGDLGLGKRSAKSERLRPDVPVVPNTSVPATSEYKVKLGIPVG